MPGADLPGGRAHRCAACRCSVLVWDWDTLGKSGDLVPAPTQAAGTDPARGSHLGWAGAGGGGLRSSSQQLQPPKIKRLLPPLIVNIRQKILKAKLALDHYETSSAK